VIPLGVYTMLFWLDRVNLTENNDTNTHDRLVSLYLRETSGFNIRGSDDQSINIELFLFQLIEIPFWWCFAIVDYRVCSFYFSPRGWKMWVLTNTRLLFLVVFKVEKKKDKIEIFFLLLRFSIWIYHFYWIW
jgi:hypothetical protein